MSTVFVHRYSGILSAYGLALADVVHEAQEPCARVYEGTCVHVSQLWVLCYGRWLSLALLEHISKH